MWKMTFTASAGVHVKSSMLKYTPIYYLHYKSVILNGNGKQASNNSGAQVIYLPLDIHTGRACSCRVSCCSGTCHEDNKWHGSFIYLQRISLSLYISPFQDEVKDWASDSTCLLTHSTAERNSLPRHEPHIEALHWAPSTTDFSNTLPYHTVMTRRQQCSLWTSE